MQVSSGCFRSPLPRAVATEYNLETFFFFCIFVYYRNSIGTCRRRGIRTVVRPFHWEATLFLPRQNDKKTNVTRSFPSFVDKGWLWLQFSSGSIIFGEIPFWNFPSLHLSRNFARLELCVCYTRWKCTHIIGTVFICHFIIFLHFLFRHWLGYVLNTVCLHY